MAATGTGNYKKAYPSLRVAQGGVFPFPVGFVVRDKSDIKQVSDLKGKRVAWDFGGHAINQTWQNAMMEMVRSRTVDVVLENFKLDFAEKALFDEPFAAALATMGIPDAGDPEKAAEALLRANTPGYDELPPEMQATLRKTIGGVTEKVIADLREKWNADLIEIVRNKRTLYEDNQQQLQEARAAAGDDAKRVAEIDESLAMNAKLMDNADSLISGFGV